MKKHKIIYNIEKIYNFKESVIFVNNNKNVYSVGKINNITYNESLIEPWKAKIIKQIKKSIDINYQMSKKKIYFIE